MNSRRQILDSPHWTKKALSRRRLKGGSGARCTPLIGTWASQPLRLSLDMSGVGGEAPASKVLLFAYPVASDVGAV